MPLDSKEIKKKRFVGLSFAWNGWKYSLKHERNIKIHTVIGVIAISFGVFLKVSTIEWSILVLTIGFVFAMELLNTAIERILDYLSPGIDPMVGLVKDIAAAAVFVSALTSIVVGMIIFLPKLIYLF
ncbi:diacylglycerol kinase family protein [Aquibacillus sp. 3ASR75-11]|uniref:Diacylglycerol kinase family protein n=1 Tax=Terrihalobacillus insolitus TaxID=2950438 RepID=A0A9X3WSC2_9BACI|nr:diacylglycerol kinase family protein [Terrihalobacillus insolitus]MDC3413354.1 diacylglycerol kinase family protein [Terrihalobacillus insolitus]MDC3424937.1 diacylglycerol kinase family protein [Terrihalobacillus insolitus]